MIHTTDSCWSIRSMAPKPALRTCDSNRTRNGSNPSGIRAKSVYMRCKSKKPDMFNLLVPYITIYDLPSCLSWSIRFWNPSQRVSEWFLTRTVSHLEMSYIEERQRVMHACVCVEEVIISYLQAFVSIHGGTFRSGFAPRLTWPLPFSCSPVRCFQW